MQKILALKLTPEQAANSVSLEAVIMGELGAAASAFTGFRISKQSIDARSKQPWINLTITAYINEPFPASAFSPVTFRDVRNAAHRVIIVGAGPAGLFAALKLAERGVKPIIIERGKDVRARRRDLANLNKEGTVNPDSNYCFGEGGAGTYSDGKLYTRSNKRGSIARILNLFAQFGADEKITYQSHPHIGTNKLPGIITAMRQQVEACGGEILFNKKLVDFKLNNSRIESVITADGDNLMADAYLLATGHSARDIFLLLHQKQIKIEQKPFALGVRIEHPQQVIDAIQYHCNVRSPFLPAAAYSLVEQVEGRGVFSFCMCPGGIIAPAATAPGELVVNGWSPSKRNNPFANSGIVVQVESRELTGYKGYETAARNLPPELLGMYFQQAVERKAFAAGGGQLAVPAQRMMDFVNNTTSSTLPPCSYVPGIHSVPLGDVLPPFINQALKIAFRNFGKKMRGYLTNEAVVVATESRTSSPVRIPRDEALLHHPQLTNLYPCAEGAGYAGGIVSAAMDGEKVAAAILQQLNIPV